MNLYQRIKARREELEMSQEELAQMLGYKSRSSINKIEKGETDIPQSKIKAFADALKTTPKYLMGWTEDSSIAAEENINNNEQFSYYLDPEVAQLADEIHKNPEMRILFDASKKLTKEDLQFVMDMVSRMRKEENHE